MFLNPWYGNQQGGQVSDVEVKQSFVPPPSLTALQLNLDRLQASLEPGWTVHLLRDGRYFYCNHASQNSSWLPPMENWENGGSSLPYGWETATDKDGKAYFINHLSKTTTYDDPRKELQEMPPSPREVDLVRDSEMGFGFVAGSEKPVIVRFVTDGGPSVDKLLPGDQILVINGEDVKKAPRDHVIQLVRSCKEKVSLTVCQPPLDNSARKSALLSAAKKQRLKNNPSRVRFAESVDINGTTSLNPSHISSSESTTPFMPNVLKVFLENGQTKSFKYDSSTTVDDVLASLHQKLGIKCQLNFSLVVEHVKSLKRNKLTLLDPNETLSKIAARPGAQMLRCLYRITFVPRDAYDFLREDSVAFEYLYLQCCNDVIQERFSPELKYEMALRLAALHIHQHALNAGASVKLSVKNIEKDFGLNRFIPTSLVESMKRKELRKVLSHFLKLHGSGPGQKQLTALQAKLHYMKIVSELPSYGAKCFSTYNSDGSTESVVLISPKFGVSQINSLKSTMPDSLCEMEQMTGVSVKTENDLTKKIEISIKDPDRKNLMFNMEDRDADEMVLVLQGYYQLLTDKSLDVDKASDRDSPTAAPPYHSRHHVATSSWNYIKVDGETIPAAPQRFADFSLVPPYQQPPDGFQIPNGHIGRGDDPPGGNGKPQLDSNMNRTMSIYENDDFSLEHTTQLKSFSAESTVEVTKQKDNTEINKSNGRRQDFHEARNVEVIKRVAEMNQMVEDAEHYLSDTDCETTDAESVKSESYGKLKHSDSLLLLTNGQRLLPNSTEGEELSGSDTDSQSTPGNSPARKSEMKTSGSSFGLHSPDNIPLLDKHQEGIQSLIKQMENKSGLPYPFAEGTLYLDPDIIDLTMIPPPITPDEDGAKVFPPQLNTPPTPFADRESLDNELKALQKDVCNIRLLSDVWDESQSDGAGSTDTDDTMSVSSMESNTSTLKSGQNNKQRNPVFTLAALRQLGFKIRDGEDIDDFIANLSIPPPPEGSNDLQSYILQREMGGEYDISAFIIPPPPPSGNKNRSSDIIRRLYEAKEGISKVVGQEFLLPDERDKDSCELKVMSEKIQKDPIKSGRVASLQRRFEGSSSSKHEINSLNNCKGSSDDSFKHKTDVALSKAIDENNKALRFLEVGSPSSDRTNSIKRPTTLKTNKCHSNKEDAGPPPPPRTPVTRSDQFSQGNKSHNVQKQTNREFLMKPGSQNAPNPVVPKSSPLRNSNAKLCFSNDSLDDSPNSPSKLSMTSSNDSLASSSSAATVKSFSPKGQEDPPALPPRPKVQRNFPNNLQEPLCKQPLKEISTPPKITESQSDCILPPAIPSRVKKPTTSTFNRTCKLSTKPRTLKTTAPQPPIHCSTLPNRKTELPEEKPRLPSKSSHTLRNSSLSRTSNATVPNGMPAKELPLKTSSPKAPNKLNLVNGERFSEDPNDSIDSGSFEQDSLEETEEIEAMPPSSREAYRVTALFIAESLKRLSSYAKVCKGTREKGGGAGRNEVIFNRSKDALTSESRQFVTASKLFVKSATETEEVLLQSLTNCVTILQKMVNLCEDMSSTTPSPEQTLGIVAKVKDVTGIYILTVRAALSAAGRGMDHPCMNTLMAQATNLAGALTSLMRILRVFSP